MRILISPNSFKGSLSATAAAAAMAAGLRRAVPAARLVLHPLADGGEGTLETLLSHLDGRVAHAHVCDPLGRPIRAAYGLLSDRNIAVVESAEIVGPHHLKPEERIAGKTGTEGLGQLLRQLLDRGFRQIWVGLGGSATVDGGAGMLGALGIRLTTEKGDPVTRGGFGLGELAACDPDHLDPRLKTCRITVLCDVLSPLAGPGGARMFMAQKGAGPRDRDRLENNLLRLYRKVRTATGRNLVDVPGAGAAGGLGAALALIGGNCLSGSAFILEKTGWSKALDEADVVITGEGHLDRQTSVGKTIGRVAQIAKERGVPVIALCGGKEDDLEALHGQGLTAAFSIVPGPVSAETAMAQAPVLMESAAYQLGCLLRSRIYLKT